MNSLPKVIKSSRLIASEEVVQIPDAVIPPAFQEEPAADESPSERAADQEEIAPAVDQSRLILEGSAVERANEVSRKILQTARTERERILEQARKESAQIRKEAYTEGFQQALDEKRGDISASLGEMDCLMNQLREEQERFLQQYEDGLADLAISIVQKVLKDSVQKDEDRIISLVKDAVSTVKNADWISVHVSNRLPELVEKLQNDLSFHQGSTRIQVSGFDIPADSCILHTPEGVVDASVSVQLDNLKTLFHHSDS